MICDDTIVVAYSEKPDRNITVPDGSQTRKSYACDIRVKCKSASRSIFSNRQKFQFIKIRLLMGHDLNS